MHDLAHLLRDPLTVGAETKTGRSQVATDALNPPPMPVGSAEYRAEHRVHPGVRV
jgi:hypothetical protein